MRKNRVTSKTTQRWPFHSKTFFFANAFIKHWDMDIVGCIMVHFWETGSAIFDLNCCCFCCKVENHFVFNMSVSSLVKRSIIYGFFFIFFFARFFFLFMHGLSSCPQIHCVWVRNLTFVGYIRKKSEEYFVCSIDTTLLYFMWMKRVRTCCWVQKWIICD